MKKLYTRCIHIFPKFENAEKLKSIREKYDYLHDCIEPHITLVFPFESDLSIKEIQLDLEEILKEVKPFKISTCELEGVDNHGYYLFLNIDDGKNNIRELHYKFHKGILSPYQSEWTKNGSFVPHITVGRFENKVDMTTALNETIDFEDIYSTIVDKFYIEIIGENEESIIEGVVKLGND
jgi:2'-5' RNA ligase